LLAKKDILSKKSISDFYQIDELEYINNEQALTEYIMLRLRLREGLDLSFLKHKFGKDLLKERSDVIKDFLKHGFVVIEENRLYLTDDGFLLSNYVISELI